MLPCVSAVQGNVQADDVAPAEELLPAVHKGHPLRRLGDKGIIGQDLHPEAGEHPDQVVGDVPQAQQSHRLAVQLGTGGELPAPALHAADGGREMAADIQNVHQRHLRYGGGVCPDHIGHRDAAPRCGGAVDVVQAHAVLLEHPHLAPNLFEGLLVPFFQDTDDHVRLLRLLQHQLRRVAGNCPGDQTVLPGKSPL